MENFCALRNVFGFFPFIAFFPTHLSLPTCHGLPLPRSLNPEGRGLVSVYGGTIIQLAIRKDPDGFTQRAIPDWYGTARR